MWIGSCYLEDTGAIPATVGWTGNQCFFFGFWAKWWYNMIWRSQIFSYSSIFWIGLAIHPKKTLFFIKNWQFLLFLHKKMKTGRLLASSSIFSTIFSLMLGARELSLVQSGNELVPTRPKRTLLLSHFVRVTRVEMLVVQTTRANCINVKHLFFEKFQQRHNILRT